MYILLDGFLILLRFLLLIGVFYLTSLGLGLIWINRLRATKDLQFLFKCALALIVGLIPLAIFSYLFIQLARFWSLAFILGSFLLAAAGITSSIWNIRKLDLFNVSGWKWLIGAACLGGFSVYLALRLAYLKEINLPPFTDSVEHFKIIKSFLDPQLTPSFFSSPYYHFGFHSLAAWFSEVTGLLPEYAISLVGQLILCLFPLSLFTLVYALKRDWKPAILTSFVGAFFWTMPAHAVDWGKFPTLAGLVVLPAALALVALIMKASTEKQTVFPEILSGIFLSMGILFLHSRMLLCFLLLIGCYLFIEWLLRKASRHIEVLIAFASLAFFSALFFTNKDLAEQYSSPLVSLIVLAVFSFTCSWFNPRMATKVAFWGIFLLLLTFLPVPETLTRYSSTWMDLPFMKIFSSLLFSILVGTGLWLTMEWMGKYRYGKSSAIAVLICLLVWTVIHQPYRPDACCNYVSSSDIATFTWIKENLPPDAQIAIPGRLDVVQQYGTDAGIWISSMTGRDTFMLPYYYVWRYQESHDRLCSRGVVYLFVSSQEMSFQVDLTNDPDWYQPIFNVENTTIYRVIGCMNN